MENGMDLPQEVNEVISRIVAARLLWDEVIEGLTDEQLLQPDVCGWWSVKDVIAHLSWYEQQMEWMAANHSVDSEGTEWWLLPMDERNDRIYQLYKELSVADVKSIAQQRYARMLAALRKLEDQDMLDPGRYHGMPAEWVPADIIAQNTWEHYEDHLVDIRAAFGL